MQRRLISNDIVAAFALALTCVLLASSTASAVCREGRETGPGPVEHCCWPGQQWSDESASCTGTAVCPRGYAAIEQRCRVIDEEPYRAGPLPPRARIVRRPSTTTVGFGFTALGTGYALAFLSAAAGTLSNQCPLCAVYAPAFVPVIGPVVSAAIYDGQGGMYRSTFWTWAVMDTVTQLVGVIGVLVGYRGQRTIVYDHTPRSIRWHAPRFALIPGSPGAPGGLTLAGSW